MSSINTRKTTGTFNATIQDGRFIIQDSNGNEITLVDTGSGNYAIPVQVGITLPSAVNNVFGQALAVPTATPTTLVTYIVPLGKEFALLRVLCSGENVATYEVLVDGVVQGLQRTYFGADLNTEFDFSALEDFGFRLTQGQVVTVRVTHDRPDPANFEARIMGSIIG